MVELAASLPNLALAFASTALQLMTEMFIAAQIVTPVIGYELFASMTFSVYTSLTNNSQWVYMPIDTI